LTTQFDWNVSDHSLSEDTSILTGVPRDDVDRAFIGIVNVHWNSRTQRPTQIQFAQSDVDVSFANLRRQPTGVVAQAVFYPPGETEAITESSAESGDVRTASATTVSRELLNSHSEEVLQLLQRWEAASAATQPWELRLHAFDYDHVFAAEEQFYVMLRGDGAGTIEATWDPVMSDYVHRDSQRLTVDGTPFALRQGRARAMVVGVSDVLFADPETQTVRRLPLSGFDQFPWYKHPLQMPSCVMFHLPVNADELASRFLWEIVSSDERQVHLHGVPANEEVALSVSGVDITLNAGTGLPEEVRCFEAAGSHEHVMRLVERAAPVGLTAEIMLEGYSHLAPALEKRQELP
jgi:hypothetical protein